MRSHVQARRRMCGGSLTTITVRQPCFRISARMLVGLLVAVPESTSKRSADLRHAAGRQEFGAPRQVGRRRRVAALESGQHDRRRVALAVERERAQRAIAVVAAQHDDRVGTLRRLRRRLEPVARPRHGVGERRGGHAPTTRRPAGSRGACVCSRGRHGRCAEGVAAARMRTRIAAIVPRRHCRCRR